MKVSIYNVRDVKSFIEWLQIQDPDTFVALSNLSMSHRFDHSLSTEMEMTFGGALVIEETPVKRDPIGTVIGKVDENGTILHYGSESSPLYDPRTADIGFTVHPIGDGAEPKCRCDYKTHVSQGIHEADCAWKIWKDAQE